MHRATTSSDACSHEMAAATRDADFASSFHEQSFHPSSRRLLQRRTQNDVDLWTTATLISWKTRFCRRLSLVNHHDHATRLLQIAIWKGWSRTNFFVSCLGDKDFSKTRTVRMERVVCPRICKLNRTKYKYRIEKGWKREEKQTRVASIYISSADRHRAFERNVKRQFYRTR